MSGRQNIASPLERRRVRVKQEPPRGRRSSRPDVAADAWQCPLCGTVYAWWVHACKCATGKGSFVAPGHSTNTEQE